MAADGLSTEQEGGRPEGCDRRNVDIHMYIDDWLIVARNTEKVTSDVLIFADS